MSHALSGRGPASSLLAKLAEYGQSGLFPNDVSCNEIGRALNRICMNSAEEDPLRGILQGWWAAAKEEREQYSVPDQLVI